MICAELDLRRTPFPATSNAESGYNNLLRKVNTSQTLYETLLKVYEQIKFEEIRNNLYIEVIDTAITPKAPIKPKKRRMVGVAGVSSLILGGFFILLLEWVKNMIKNIQT